MSLLLQSCDWVVTQDTQRRVIPNVSVRVEDGRIAEIGRLRRLAKEKVIDCRRMALIPGLIKTHTHLAMTLFRGYADDLELQDWLEKKIWPGKAAHTRDLLQWNSPCLPRNDLDWDNLSSG